MADEHKPESADDEGKVAALERKVKLLEESLGQAVRLRQMFDQTAQELEVAKSQLLQQNEALDGRVQERTRQLLAAQEELVRAEKLAVLGQVADTVGHELRNPLGVMSNAVYYLQAVLGDADETTKEYLGIIKDEIGDAERIVSDLLDAVRTKPPNPVMVEIAGMVEQALRKCDIPSAVTVRLDIPDGLPVVRVDPMHLHQVLWNLITNAVEAMPKGGTLTIRAAEDQTAHVLRISVRDNGTGVAPEHLARLFEPMFTTKARRVGLGLVVVKNLTQANGGSVGVESEPGRGSTVTVSLPYDNPHE
jgi:signal transduction histidine kinase